MSGFETRETDFDTMVWPQIIRGCGIMLCILPATRLALGHLDLKNIPNASGLFNVTRNLGGAIGLALIDTIIYGRAPVWGNWIKDHLLKGDVKVAEAVGIPIDAFLAARGQPIDDDTRELLRPMVEKLALVHAINEAWLILGLITVVSMLSLYWVMGSKLTTRPELSVKSEDEAA